MPYPSFFAPQSTSFDPPKIKVKRTDIRALLVYLKLVTP